MPGCTSQVTEFTCFLEQGCQACTQIQQTRTQTSQLPWKGIQWTLWRQKICSSIRNIETTYVCGFSLYEFMAGISGVFRSVAYILIFRLITEVIGYHFSYMKCLLEEIKYFSICTDCNTSVLHRHFSHLLVRCDVIF